LPNPHAHLRVPIVAKKSSVNNNLLQLVSENGAVNLAALVHQAQVRQQQQSHQQHQHLLNLGSVDIDTEDASTESDEVSRPLMMHFAPQ
jgi:hypothetical protein